MISASITDLSARLREHGITPTLQRLQVAEVMLSAPVHLNADQVLASARTIAPEISRATVYSTLSLLSERGLLRTLDIDGTALVFDSTLTPHHHLFDLDTRTVSDLPADALELTVSPALAQDFDIASIELVVKVRRRPR
ncbi:MAG: Fur family transcriptional regulator [Burkholderiaceae bacterium]